MVIAFPVIGYTILASENFNNVYTVLCLDVIKIPSDGYDQVRR